MKNIEDHYRREVDILRDENKSVNQILDQTKTELLIERRDFENRENEFKSNIATLEEKSTTLA